MIWLAESVMAEGVALRIGRDRQNLVAEWPNGVRFIATQTGESAHFDKEPQGANAVKIRLTARALLRHVHGKLTLHASAVAHEKGAIAFMGDSGAGKSTLAAFLARGKFGLLSDDLLFVDGVDALPTETASSLDASAVRAIPDGSPRLSAAKPLQAVIYLAYGENHTLKPVRGARAASVLMRSTVRFILDDAAVMHRDMDSIQALMGKAPVFELCRPYGLEHLPATAAFVENWMGT